MAKVLLVEDDNNLREIYQARLTAEGYDIVTAQNGEEALVVAKQNKPDLIISDVMMPRISGFEMLDILRNTDELKDTRVIMLTALGQSDDQKRATSLGADRYLVKSQVTLEDIVNSAKELLVADGNAAAPAQQAPAAPSLALPAASPAPVANTPAASVAPTMAATPVQPDPTAPAPNPVAAPAPSAVNPVAAPQPTPAQPATPPSPAAPTTPVASAPATPPAPEAVASAPAEEPAGVPMPDPATAEGPTAPATPPSPATVDAAAQGLEAEEAALQAQIASYSQQSSQPADGSDAATATSNDQAIAEAVKQLNTPSEPTPAMPPSAADPAPAAGPTPAPASESAAAPAVGDNVSVAGKKIIQPINDPTAKPDINALLAKEEAKSTPEAGGTPPATPGKPFDPNTAL